VALQPSGEAPAEALVIPVEHVPAGSKQGTGIVQILDAFLGNQKVRRRGNKKSLPKRDQKGLLHYLDTFVQKNTAAR
jgi:hypothetical protein